MSDVDQSGWGSLLASGAMLIVAAWACDSTSGDPPPIVTTPVDAVRPMDNIAAEPPPAPVVVPAATANWDFREGQEYGYVAAVSEEDRKRGRAAGSVHLFRYLGQEDGKHVLVSLGDDGAPFARSYCASPCVAIKTVFGDGGVRRIAYDTDSVIGAAFEDAIAGRMKVYAEVRQAQPPHNPADELELVDENGTVLGYEPARSD